MEEIKQLGYRLKEHGIGMSDAIAISTMIDDPEDRAQMIEFLDENPEAGEQEIVALANKLMKATVKRKFQGN